MQIHILSLFPEYFSGPFDVSIVKRARENGFLDVHLVDIRDFADNKHGKVDDRPFGGGPGMVLMPHPVVSALRSVRREGSHVVYLSPQGTVLNAAKCAELSRREHLILLCGHYEGIDQRVLESCVDEEISIGDFVLTSGCPAAALLLDAVIRFIPGVIGHPDAVEQDSFQQQGMFDCPHYTRPEEFEGKRVPEILLSGHHKNIAAWRSEQAIEKTARVRPDLVTGKCV